MRGPFSGPTKLPKQREVNLRCFLNSFVIVGDVNRGSISASLRDQGRPGDLGDRERICITGAWRNPRSIPAKSHRVVHVEEIVEGLWRGCDRAVDKSPSPRAGRARRASGSRLRDLHSGFAERPDTAFPRGRQAGSEGRGAGRARPSGASSASGGAAPGARTTPTSGAAQDERNGPLAELPAPSQAATVPCVVNGSRHTADLASLRVLRAAPLGFGSGTACPSCTLWSTRTLARRRLCCGDPPVASDAPRLRSAPILQMRLRRGMRTRLRLAPLQDRFKRCSMACTLASTSASRLRMRPSILRTALITVVWSLPPKRSPSSV